MKKENVKKVIIALVIIFIIAAIGYFIYQKIFKKDSNPMTEITPQEEVSEEQLRQTMVTLYFQNKENATLMPEARIIDVKELAQNPYEKLVQLLMEGPKSEKLEKTIPEGTKLNSSILKGDILILDFSKEFIENCKEGEEAEKNVVYAIVNTLTELTEVNSIKITIDGEENKGFSDGAVNFEKLFTKIED
ncbi:MAG: GerMN domain-containing protein [Clostridia bacterium]